MALEFEWYSAKAVSNLAKHGVGFEDAVTVFDDPLSTTVIDPHHSRREERFIIFGRSSGGRILAVMHTDRGNRVRIISAREATRAERNAYDEEAR